MADPTFVFQFDGFRRLTQSRFDNTGPNNLPLYRGTAKLGVATSDAAWLIEKFTYDANNMVSWIQVSGENKIWDNRATTVVFFGS